MPTQYHVSISPRSRGHLRGIFEYIAKHSAQNASKMVVELLDAIDSLDQFPHRFDVPRGKVTKRRNYRSMPVPPYLVRYRIDEVKKTVFVTSVRHGARKN